MKEYHAPIYPLSPSEFEGVEPEWLYQVLDALPPTPKGIGHIGPVKSGEFIHLRFALPEDKPLAYFINLRNIVAYNGGGTFYQLEVRKGDANGKIIYKSEPYDKSDGPGSFNDAPFSKIEVPLYEITEAEWLQGFIDIFATVHVKDDDWTIYRDADDGGPWDIVAYAFTISPKVEERRALVKKIIEREIYIIPQPRELQIKNFDFRINSATKIVLDKKATEEALFAANLLAEEIEKHTLSKLSIRTGIEQANNVIILGTVNRDAEFDRLLSERNIAVGSELGDQGYIIEVFEDIVIGAARHSTGLFYAVQTLIQLLDKNLIKGVSITDWPALKWRMVQYDIARGQLVRPNYIKRIIRELARAKINMLMVYLEDDFHYSKYPFLGRDETFTPEIAKELSEYAKKFHVQLVPQQEAFGHMSNMLNHEELAELREAGNSWVICPSHPRTKPFLSDLFTELSQSFTNTNFMHAGGDEFIWLYGKCPVCKSKAENTGVDGLYSFHLHNIYEIVKGLGKRLMIWTHMPPSEGEFTLKAKRKGLIPEDVIPFLWFYGIGDFVKKIRLYKDAGFKEIFVAPSVINYVKIYPPYREAFINIRNYIKAAAQEGCVGECTCTWELYHGSLFETCWYGLIYSGECAWSPEWTEKRFYDRKFAKFWFGVNIPDISRLLFNPWEEFKDSFWQSSIAVRNAFYMPLQKFMKFYTKYRGSEIKMALEMIKKTDAFFEHINELKGKVTKNGLTLELLRIPLMMYRVVAFKAIISKTSARVYTEAYKLSKLGLRLEVIEMLKVLKSLFGRLLEVYKKLISEFRVAINCCGASYDDLSRFTAKHDEVQSFINEIDDIIKKFEMSGEIPEPLTLGLEEATYHKIFEWKPHMVSSEFKSLRFDASGFINSPGVYIVDWNYEHGAHGLAIKETRVEINGEIVYSDVHDGWSGRYKKNQSYVLRIDTMPPNAKVELCGIVRSDGGTDSHGAVWIAKLEL